MLKCNNKRTFLVQHMLMLAKVLSGLNDVDYASIKTDMNFIFIVAFKLFLGLT